MEVVAWPRRSWTYLGCFPVRRRIITQKWRRSWKRTSGSPARRKSGLKLRVVRSWRDAGLPLRLAKTRSWSCHNPASRILSSSCVLR